MGFKSSRTVERELKALVNTRENANRCGECGATYPTWCSVNLGVFLCGRCASLHRRVLNGSNGGIESYVKSLTLDRWTAEDLDDIANSGGNRKNHMVWNAKNQGFPFNGDDDKAQAEMFIRDKYINGRFRNTPLGPSSYSSWSEPKPRSQGSGISEYGSNSASSRGYSRNYGSAGYSSPSVRPAETELPSLTHRTVSDHEIGRYATEFSKMRKLGYTDTDSVVESLVLANGDINIALDILEKDAKQKQRSPTPPTLPKRASASSTPRPAVFDGFTGATPNSATQQPLQAQPTVFDGTVEQYLDPATGQVYVDQAQYMMAVQMQQQQQLAMQQTQQQPTIDKNALMALYDRPDLLIRNTEANPESLQYQQLVAQQQQQLQQLQQQQQLQQIQQQQQLQQQQQQQQQQLPFMQFPQQPNQATGYSGGAYYYHM